MSKVSSLKIGFVDLAAALFVIGGVMSVVISILTLPIASIYPFQVQQTFNFVPSVVLVVSLICSLGAIHCHTLTSRRLLSQAGMRGIIFGALLLTFSLGLIGTYRDVNATLGAASAILVLVAGSICFVLRETVLPRPPILHEPIPLQRTTHN